MAYRPKPPLSKARTSSPASKGRKAGQQAQSPRAAISDGKPWSARGRKQESKAELIPKSKAAAVKAQEAKVLDEQKRAARSKRWAEQRSGSAQSNQETSARGGLSRERPAASRAARKPVVNKPPEAGLTAGSGREIKSGNASGKRQARTAAPRKGDSKPIGLGAAKPATPERIAKVIARAGVCSRRDAESFIEQGRVSLNGKVIDSPALNVSAGDDVRIDGNPLGQREKTRLFLFHKPRGLVTTDRDPEGRPTVFEHLRKSWPDGPRVMSIGRLDINTEGLLLLTNDGGLARVLELPATGWTRRYRVRANGKTDQAVLDSLRGGVTIDGVDYAGIEASLDRQQGANVWLTISLREGKNREVKRVLEHIGLFVNRLIRLSFGPFQLGELEEGAVSEVKTRILADQLGPVLSESARADFLSPLLEEVAKDLPAPAVLLARSSAKLPAPRPDIPQTRRSHEMRPKTEPAQRTARRQSERKERLEPEDRPKLIRPLPGPRKHISALRQAVAESVTPRQRVAKETTTDRKGRTVRVERISRSGERETPAVSSRNKNRFDNEKTGSGRTAPARSGKLQDRTRNAEMPGRRDKQRVDAKPFASRSKAGGPRHKPERGGQGKSPRNIIDANPS